MQFVLVSILSNALFMTALRTLLKSNVWTVQFGLITGAAATPPLGLATIPGDASGGTDPLRVLVRARGEPGVLMTYVGCSLCGPLHAVLICILSLVIIASLSQIVFRELILSYFTLH